MAVTLKVKKSPKSSTVMMVDRIVELKKQIDALSVQQKEYATMIATLRAQAMEQDPKQVVTFAGTDYQIVFSEASKTRKLVDMAGAKKALGNETFMTIAKITLGDLDKYLTPEELDGIVVEEDGPRRVEIMEK